jgi:pyrroline-5-carboxylate reductase
MINASLVTPDQIIASKTSITTDGICRLTQSNIEVVLASTIIIIAVKPAVVSTVLKEISDFQKTSDRVEKVKIVNLKAKCFISIAAGVSLDNLESLLIGNSFIRVMPNTPCCVGECAAAYSMGKHATADHKTLCEAIFNSVGIVNEVPEKLMDSITGLSGSGPACKKKKRGSQFSLKKRPIL